MEASPYPRLQKNPTVNHKPDNYTDLEDLEYPGALYSAMEQYLPPNMLGAPRNRKILFMDKILAKYRPNADRARVSTSVRSPGVRSE